MSDFCASSNQKISHDFSRQSAPRKWAGAWPDRKEYKKYCFQLFDDGENISEQHGSKLHHGCRVYHGCKGRMGESWVQIQ